MKQVANYTKMLFLCIGLILLFGVIWIFSLTTLVRAIAAIGVTACAIFGAVCLIWISQYQVRYIVLPAPDLVNRVKLLQMDGTGESILGHAEDFTTMHEIISADDIHILKLPYKLVHWNTKAGFRSDYTRTAFRKPTGDITRWARDVEKKLRHESVV